ncbi:hypothetical protein TrST_g12762 [Triparma strigata]|uniref:Uncharacterized protein n=1 Tax=Triparma strigata TaxID=1606541 RepID=A0A9W7A0B5_9STRA|nr:hypothetical protein TrST_g12762 [Triparma strigata]
MLNINEMEDSSTKPLLQSDSETPAHSFMTPDNFLSDFASGEGDKEDKQDRTYSLTSVEMGETPSSSPTSTRRGCGRLSRLQCGLLSLAIFAVLAVVGVVVGGPEIANTELQNSEVTFTKLTMSNPSSTDYSFDVAADVKISNVKPIDGTIGEMTVDLSYDNVKLGSLKMPPIDVKAGKDNYKSIDSQRFEVNPEAYDTWDKFSNAMLMEKTVDWVLNGEASVTSSIMGISMSFGGLNFEKEIPLSCFDGLDDVQMSVFDLTQSTPDSIIVQMTVCLKNPSDISVGNLGDMYFGVYYNNSYMGNVTATDAETSVTKDDASSPGCEQFGEKGYNSIPMFGNLVPADDAHDAADQLMSRYLSGKSSPVSAKALSPIADSLPLFNTGMQGLSLDTTLNGDETPLIVGIEFKSATVTPINNDACAMDMVADVSMQNPLGPESPLYITTVDMTVDMGYNGAKVGQAKTFETDVPEPNEVKGNDVLTVPAYALMELFDKGASLTAFAKDLINLDTLEVSLTGSTGTTAYCPALGYNMNIAEVPIVLPNEETNPALPPVTIQGMGGLKDVTITEYSISGNAPPSGDCTDHCGLVVSVTARIVNPSPFGMVLGTLNAEMLDHNKVKLGTVGTVEPLTLSPGVNNVTMAGILHPDDADALDAAADFMSAYMNNSAQVTTVRGTDAGDTPVDWLNDIVNGLELSTVFPGAGDDFEALTEIEIIEMEMELTTDSKARVASTVKARLNVPAQVDPSIILNVTFSGMVFDLIDPETNSHLGGIELDVTDVPVTYEDGYITASFSKTDMVIKDFDGTSDLIAQLMVNPDKTVRMEGKASPLVETGMGWLQLKDVPFGGETVMYGFNNLVDPNTNLPEMKITKIDIESGEDGILNLLIDCDVTNPSNVKPEMGKVSMDLWTYNETHVGGFETKIGTVTIEEFTLEANTDRNAVTRFTNVKAQYVTPDGDHAKRAGDLFLSNFVSGVDQKARIKGNPDGSGTDIDLLKPALKILSSSSDVPGLVGNVLTHSVMHFPSLLHLTSLPTILFVSNPFSADMTVTSSHCEIYPCYEYTDDTNTVCDRWYDGSEHGQDPSEHHYGSAGYYTPDDLDVTVKAGEVNHELEEKAVALYSALSLEMATTLFSSSTGGALIRLEGVMGIQIGGFSMDVHFAEAGVPICLGWSFFGNEHECDNTPP